MRYLVGFVFALALLALPLGVGAQDTDVAAGSPQEPEESALSDEQVSDDGALNPRLRKRTRQQWDPDTYELRLDSSGVSLSQPQAPRRKTDARLKQYRQGVIASSLALGIGGALIGSGVVVLRRWQEEQSLDSSFELDLFPPAGTYVLFTLGSMAALGGIIGVAISASNLGARKRTLRELQEAQYGTPRRVQWDLARSRLQF